MDIGTQVIRKVDVRDAVPVTGEIISVEAKGRVRVYWNISQIGGHRGHTSTLKASSLVEATQEVMVPVRERYEVRHKEHLAKLDAERVFLCTNVNPAARGSMYGHPKPLPLTEKQVVEGKCFYCGKPVVLRGEGKQDV